MQPVKQSPSAKRDISNAANLDNLRNAMRSLRDRLSVEPSVRSAWIEASADYYMALHPEEASWRHRDQGDAGIPTVREIQDRAAVADRAWKARPPTGRIDPDPEQRDLWSTQVGWAQEALALVFSDAFWAAESALKAGDSSGLEYGIRFLEADPVCYRAGRTKGRLIFPITRCQLDKRMLERLRSVVLAVVDDPRRRRELRHYGRLAYAVGTANLRHELGQRTLDSDPQVRFNARTVLEGWTRLSSGDTSAR